MVRKRTLFGVSLVGASVWACWHVRQARAFKRVLLTRVRGEYREMPGLSLTVAQACRLWQLDARTCKSLFETLIRSGELYRTGNGRFIAMA